jgi:HK97 family phage prohead protease
VSPRDHLAVTPRRPTVDYLDPAPWRLPESASHITDYLAVTPAVVRPKLVIRSAEPVRFREDGDGSTLEGRMVPYDEWTEINNSKEGHILERFAPGALARTISEHGARIRALFEHGEDKNIGRQPIAVIEDMRDEPDGAYYRASLLEGLPPLLVAGLRRGLYGSSIRFGAIRADRVRSPRRSSHNPDGIPEVTVREARVREFSVVTFPQYAGATAAVRIHEI